MATRTHDPMTIPSDLEIARATELRPLPAVAERIDQLPQAGCADNERCSPCCDFYSGEPTGSCGFGCDAWEDEGGTCDVIYEPCCEEKGRGHCIPQDNIPSDLLENVERFVVSELIREQAFHLLDKELPYALAVEIEEFVEDDIEWED